MCYFHSVSNFLSNALCSQTNMNNRTSPVTADCMCQIHAVCTTLNVQITDVNSRHYSSSLRHCFKITIERCVTRNVQNGDVKIKTAHIHCEFCHIRSSHNASLPDSITDHPTITATHQPACVTFVCSHNFLNEGISYGPKMSHFLPALLLIQQKQKLNLFCQ